MSLFERHLEVVERELLLQVAGRLTGVSGLAMTATGLQVPVGSMCRIDPERSAAVEAQVIGFRGAETILSPLTEPLGVAAGDRVVSCTAAGYVPVGRQMQGRVLDGLGRPIDGGGGFTVEAHYAAMGDPPAPMRRRAIDTSLGTGIRSIDALLTMGRGQRLGVFAGTGVGKSVLMGMIARYTASDVNVVALIGERGREVGDFVRREIGEEGMKRSVLVVSTSDQSPVLRVRACFTATAIAEYFRDQGADVLLMMDSLTRMAMAQRQIGLAAGEPPATKGYTPSVFALIPNLLERAGRTDRGSITGLYTVLVEGDDVTEPVSDAVRGTLDGHVWLARKLANRGHYPAVDPLESISRLMVNVVDDEHRKAAQLVRSALATWADIEDMVNIGAYAAGSNADYDVAVQMKPQIDAFLRQQMDECVSIAEARDGLVALGGRISELRRRLAGRSGEEQE